MEKKNYTRPVMDIELFVANNFCSACGDGTTMVTYEFWCNAGTGDYYVWEETNGRDGLQTSGGYGYNADKCWAGTNGTWYSYHPCNQSHSVTVPKGTSIDNIFPYGYISKNGNGSNYTRVRLWLDRQPDPVTGNATDIHCTTKLNTSEFTPHNPS